MGNDFAIFAAYAGMLTSGNQLTNLMSIGSSVYLPKPSGTHSFLR